MSLRKIYIPKLKIILKKKVEEFFGHLSFITFIEYFNLKLFIKIDVFTCSWVQNLNIQKEYTPHSVFIKANSLKLSL